MATLALIFLIAAFILFLFDALLSHGWRVNIQSLGLACLALSILLGGASLT